MSCNFLQIDQNDVQSDQKEDKSEQALQIIDHVIAEFCSELSNKRQF
jgi:hypothetical protein